MCQKFRPSGVIGPMSSAAISHTRVCLNPLDIVICSCFPRAHPYPYFATAISPFLLTCSRAVTSLHCACRTALSQTAKPRRSAVCLLICLLGYCCIYPLPTICFSRHLIALLFSHGYFTVRSCPSPHHLQHLESMNKNAYPASLHCLP